MTTRMILFALTYVSLASLVPTTQAVSAEQPPNIVLIISDDQSWTDYGFMGHEAIQTPNLDRLAKQGATFRRGYVPTALCRPSLTTLATGLYSHQSLITGNDPAATPENRHYATRTGKDPRELLISNIDENPTVPRLLAEHGYLSFQCGKWWEGSFQRGGFTHGMTRGYPEPGGRHGDDGLKIGREGMQPVNDFIDTAIKAQKPFFVWYAPFLPHTPHNPPKRLLDKYAQEGRPKPIATYYAMCEWFDETCGQLLDRLEEKGVAENTLVVYVTDNGWIQNPDSGGYAPRSKRSPYEGGTRTPIMFRWPAKVKAANRPELCSSIDIVPTILAAAGVEIPKRLPGLNLLPNLQERMPIERDAVFGESFAHDIADIENPQASLLYRWVIRDHSKLLLTYNGQPGKMKYPPAGGQPQLFDLQSDPHENANLAAKQPGLVKELSGLLKDWYPMTDRTLGVAPAAKVNLNRRTRRSKPLRATTPKPQPANRPLATKPNSDRPNTVIIYSADNGYDLGDRGFAGKWTHYEQSLRVPLIVYDPRLPEARRGQVRSEMTLNSDLASTMIELGGETPPASHSGCSLAPLIQGESPSDWRTDFLCEFLAVPRTIPLWEGVRDSGWVYARYYVNGPDKKPFEFLHDMKSDPDQLVNITTLPAGQQSATHREALAKLRVRCDELIARNGPAMDKLRASHRAQPRKMRTGKARDN
jgi:arylsulfatase A-like enzyme